VVGAYIVAGCLLTFGLTEQFQALVALAALLLLLVGNLTFVSPPAPTTEGY
jgi:hypothetical protein